MPFVCLSITALQATQMLQDVDSIFAVAPPASLPASTLPSLPEGLLGALNICT
jgi:hypothetical protein